MTSASELHASYHGVSRLNWDQIREVSAAGPDSGVTNTPILGIIGDEVTLSIGQGRRGSVCTSIAWLHCPPFPSRSFRRMLDTSMPDGEVVVWRRGFPSLPKAHAQREISPAAKDAYLSPNEIVVRVDSAFSNVRVKGPGHLGHIAEAFEANWMAKLSLGRKLWAKELEQMSDAVTIYVDDERKATLLCFTATRGRLCKLMSEIWG